MSKLKKTTLYVKGMHCPSCEVLMNDKFREEGNVEEVKPDFKKQTVEVFYTGHLNRERVNEKIRQFGYEIVDGKLLIAQSEPFGKRLFEAVAITVILLILYLIGKELSIVPEFNFTGNLSLISVFVIGLVASTSTCMATSGALFLSMINRNKGNSDGGEQKPENGTGVGSFGKKNLDKAILFNLGRVISYGAFGFIAGLVGQVLVTNFNFGAYLTLIAAVFMIFLGLDMAKVMPLGTLIPSGFNKSLFSKLEEKLKRYPRKAPFLLGALTYLLPCGFTQAVQVYAIGVASPVQSAIIMTIFAIGTMPALLLIGSMTNFTKASFYKYFLKVMGVLVFIVGLVYFSNFLSLYGININPLGSSKSNNGTTASKENGVQVINMRVVASGYVPNVFSVQKGIPVKWKIQGENVFGCQAYFVVPSLNYQKIIEPGENLIEFTPKDTGTINFSCGMGMYRGQIFVTD